MPLSDLILRPEAPEDYFAVEQLTREAFWNLYKPGCDEHYLLHRLRQSPGYMPDMHMLALRGHEILGNIAYSRAHVVDEAGKKHGLLCFGPLGVLPPCQGQGIGSLLVRHSLALARQKGERAVIIFGHPAYYQRFGFENAQRYGITTADGKNFDAFMALPLYEGALAGISGRFHADAAFDNIDPAEVERFDSAFPPKVKLQLPGQLKSSSG